MNEVKPCPFCGGKACLVVDPSLHPRYRYYGIKCTECGIETKFYFKAEFAVEEWNRRAEE